MGKKKKQHTRLVGEQHLSVLRDEPEIVLDLETSGLSPWKDKIAVVSLYGPKSKTGVVIHNRGRKLSKELKQFIGSRDLVIGHNIAGFDLLFLKQAGVDVFEFDTYDTMLGELCILTTDRRDVSANLKSTLARRTGVKIAKNADHDSWMNPTLDSGQLDYCFDDIEELAALRTAQMEKADDDQLNAMEIENQLSRVIVQMRDNGMPLDVQKLRKFIDGDPDAKKGTVEREGQRGAMRRLERVICDQLGDINLNSPIQVKKAINLLGLDLPSTNAQTLQDQALFGGDFGKLCEDILEHRHASQRIKMYKEEWISKYVFDGVIHPHMWTCSTDTGRMSSSDPNLQQWPKNMRGVIGGEPGYEMVWADYSQIEVRVAAAVSDCPGLKKAFEDGLHIHTDIASKAFHVSYTSVSEGLIRLAKGLTFTLLFGGSWETFQIYARRAGHNLTDTECTTIFDNFFREYPGMARLKKTASRMCWNAKQTGKPVVLRLPTGLKRVLIDWKAKPSRVMNTLIQGGAAAGLKFAMLDCYDGGLADYLGAAVHDELVGCVPKKMVREYKHALVECMVSGMGKIMDVPVVVEVKSARYWG